MRALSTCVFGDVVAVHTYVFSRWWFFGGQGCIMRVCVSSYVHTVLYVRSYVEGSNVN